MMSQLSIKPPVRPVFLGTECHNSRWGRHALHAAVLLAGLLALAACGTSGSSRECSFARPLVLSHKSIAGLDQDDARAVLMLNRQIQEICR